MTIGLIVAAGCGIWIYASLRLGVRLGRGIRLADVREGTTAD